MFNEFCLGQNLSPIRCQFHLLRATDGARVLQVCRAHVSGSVERHLNLRFGWRGCCVSKNRDAQISQVEDDVRFNFEAYSHYLL